MAAKRKDHLKISLAAEKRSDFAGFAPNMGELPKKTGHAQTAIRGCRTGNCETQPAILNEAHNRHGVGWFSLRNAPMATTANIHAPLGAVTVLRLVDAVYNVKSSFLAWKEARETRTALSVLTDTQLEDIGLTRADIAKL